MFFEFVSAAENLSLINKATCLVLSCLVTFKYTFDSYQGTVFLNVFEFTLELLLPFMLPTQKTRITILLPPFFVLFVPLLYVSTVLSDVSRSSSQSWMPSDLLSFTFRDSLQQNEIMISTIVATEGKLWAHRCKTLEIHHKAQAVSTASWFDLTRIKWAECLKIEGICNSRSDGF